jgi:hypothetical protein
VVWLGGAARATPAAWQAEAAKSSGWVCGEALDESHAFVSGANLELYPPAEASAADAAPVAQGKSDERGNFCLQDIAPGFYELRVVRDPWPTQPSRAVEVRAGLVNRLTPPIELELEPGVPRVSFEESFDGMSPGAGRAVIERLLLQGDTASIQEVARRLLPKRGVMIDLKRLALGLDMRALVQDLLRRLDSGSLPPLKTARYVYAVGELSDPRTRGVVVPALLQKLRDGRPLPATLTATLGQAEGRTYVSDIAIHALARFAGKDFKWNYGKPPLQNQRAIVGARDWWRSELAKESENKR